MLQYPFNPHLTIYSQEGLYGKLVVGFDTREEADALVATFCRETISHFLSYLIDDVMHLATTNSLQHITDAETLAFARARIPSNVHSNDTTRFLIALSYEIHIGIPIYETHIKNNIILHQGKYRLIPSAQIAYLLYPIWQNTALKIVEIMDDAASKVGTVLAGNADHIRDAALIDIGEKTGLEISNGANRIGFSFGERRGGRPEGDLISYVLEANKSFFVERVESLRFAGRKANQTDTITLTAKNGPTEITITPISTGSVGKSVLAKDASRTMTNLELTSNVVSTQPIIAPTATKELPDIADLEVGESQSVNLAGLFTGIRVNITITSSDETKATINHVANTTTMSVSAVAVGTSTITVTGTNEAGNISVEFDVTVIAAEE